jgi:hypothetical protein
LTAIEPMHLSEAELRAMTSDLDAMHHDVALPALKSSLAEWAEDIRAQAPGDGHNEQPFLARRRRAAAHRPPPGAPPPPWRPAAARART